VFHAGCYVQHERNVFPVLESKDLDDALLDEQFDNHKDKNRFKVAQDGDHFMTPFQCDSYHFFNIQGRTPLQDRAEDVLLLMTMRRANLDAFWSREKSTVASNRREGIRFENTCRTLGISNPYPPKDPFPTEDTFGMIVSCSILIRSLDSGKNAEHVQFETICKIGSHCSNYFHTTPNGLGATFISGDGPDFVVSNSPTSTQWFKKFMQGCHKCIEDVLIPDRPLVLSEIHNCLSLLESDWVATEVKEHGQRIHIALCGFMLAACFLGGF